MRRGIDGLLMIAQQALGKAPSSGAAIVFRNRLGNRIKVLVWDGAGVWFCQRRLHEGHFVLPKSTDTCFYGIFTGFVQRSHYTFV